MSSALRELLDRCKGSVTIQVNCHRDCYETVEQYLNCCGLNGRPAQVLPEIRELMVKTDTIVEIQAYPETPVSFVKIYSHSLESAVAEVVKAIDEGWK